MGYGVEGRTGRENAEIEAFLLAQAIEGGGGLCSRGGYEEGGGQQLTARLASCPGMVDPRVASNVTGHLTVGHGGFMTS